MSATQAVAHLLDRGRAALSHPRWGRPLQVVITYVLVVEIGVQLLWGQVDIPFVEFGFIEIGRGGQTIPRALFATGAVIGSLYALVGMGLILINRANNVINFAQAQLGAVPATFALLLMARRGLPYLAAIPIVVIGSLALGAASEVLVVRRFRNAPTLILTVATIGLGLLLLGAEFIVKATVTGNLFDSISGFETPLSSLIWRVGSVTFNGNHALTVIVVGSIVSGVGLFLTRTDLGIAVRASAENPDRARLLGVPVDLVSTVVWALAALLSAIGVFLRAPLVGLPLTGFVGPSILLFGLTAAVIARMRDLPTAFVAGMAIGVIDRAAVFGTNSASQAEAVMLVVILAALFFQRAEGTRVEDLLSSAWAGGGELRPVPTELRDLPEIRNARWALITTVAALVLATPAIVGDAQVGLATQVVIFAIIGISIVILTGWAGQISLGQFAVAGIGAMVAGGLAANHNLDFFIVTMAGTLAGAGAALLVGLPAVRIQGMYLAVATLAFASAVENFFLRRQWFSWLLPGEFRFAERPVLFGRIDIDDDRRFFYLCVLFLMLALAMASSLRRLRSGRIFIGMRDNNRLLQSFGVNLARTRLAAFAISGGFAGLGGSLLVFQLRTVVPEAFPPEASIAVFAMTVIGGVGSLPGAVLGAVYVKGVTLLPLVRDLDRSIIELLPSAIGLLVLLYFFPGGLIQGVDALRTRFLRWVAARHDLHVPSLIADALTLDAQPLDAQPLDHGSPNSDSPNSVTPTTTRTGDSEDVVLACHGVEVAYDKVQVLFGVDFELRRGEVLALLGTNGAGKSTLLRAIVGLSDCKGGSVTYGGVDIGSRSPQDRARSGISMVPGGKGIFPSVTVDEHLRLAAWLSRDDHDAVQVRRNHVLATFPKLADLRSREAGNLSGGEQQMLAVGMALMNEPDVLIIDELSLGLAPAIVAEMLDIVRRINAAGVSVIVVEQSLNVALTVADRAYFLEKGEVRFEGSTEELTRRDDIVRSVFLSSASTSTSSGTTHSRPRRRRQLQAPGNPLLRVEGISKRFGGVHAVNDVSFAVREHESLGLIGSNGAGKTTVFDLISGFLDTDSGTVQLGGAAINALPPDERAAMGLGRSFQDARLAPSLTVAENLALGFERHLWLHDHLASLIALPSVTRLEEDVAWSVGDLVAMMGLEAYRDKYVRELSTGTRRVVDLAMCIAHRPRVLMLDEPSSGISQRESEALVPLLRRVRDDIGCSLLVIEHDMPLISEVCDRLVALELGKEIATGTPAEVLSNPAVMASYLGSDAAAINRSGVS